MILKSSTLQRYLPILFCAFLLIATPAVQAEPATLPDSVSALTEVEGVQEYQLKNGLRILLAPDNSKSTTTVNMTYLVGSRHENYGQTGMAHLLEHLLFRGTPSQPNALAEFSRRGLQANGSTSADRTNYFASFSANPDTLEWYINWQADAMQNTLVTQAELDAEMTVVRNEMERGENNPFQVLMQKMQAAAFQWHNYGKTTIGARSDVENVDIAQLQAFYKLYYQPDNAVLIVSGQFDVANTLQIIDKAFSAIAHPKRQLPPEYTIEPVQDGERKITLRRQSGTPLVAALYHIPPAGHPSYTALNLGVGILSDTPSGRLYRTLVQKELSTDVFGIALGMYEPGYALFGAQLEPEMSTQAALEALVHTLETPEKYQFTETDLERVRNQWLNAWSRTFSDPAKLANALSEAVADGDWRLFFLHRDQTEKASLSEVEKATRQYLVASNRTAGIYIPTEQPLRAPALLPVDLEQQLKEYQGKSMGPQADNFNSTPENINKQTQRSLLRLENGDVQLALLPKATRGDRVEARLSLRFGDAELLQDQRVAATMTAALLTRGTSKLNRQEISDRLDALNANVHISGQGTTVAASLSTTKEHLPDLVSLVLHLLRDSTFPESELTEIRRQLITSISDARSDPQALAARAIERHANSWPKNDIRYTPSFEEALADIRAIRLEDIKDFYHQFYGAGNILFSAVGAFDADAVKQAIQSGLEGWKKAPAYKRIEEPYHFVEPATFAIDTPDKANAFYLSVQALDLQDTDPRYPALYLADHLLGRSETSRLWTRVRTQEGLSYDVRSSLSVSSFEPSASWSIYAIFAPENTQKLKTVIAEELQKVLADGFTEEEVQEGIKSLLNYRKLARAQDRVLSASWLHYMDIERDFLWSEKMDEDLQKLNAETVNAALRAVLNPEEFSTAIAADKSKQKP